VIKAEAYQNEEPLPLAVMLAKMRFEFAVVQAEAAKGAAADRYYSQGVGFRKGSSKGLRSLLSRTLLSHALQGEYARS
jgi:hypothetical protein